MGKRPRIRSGAEAVTFFSLLLSFQHLFYIRSSYIFAAHVMIKLIRNVTRGRRNGLFRLPDTAAVFSMQNY